MIAPFSNFIDLEFISRNNQKKVPSNLAKLLEAQFLSSEIDLTIPTTKFRLISELPFCAESQVVNWSKKPTRAISNTSTLSNNVYKIWENLWARTET